MRLSGLAAKADPTRILPGLALMIALCACETESPTANPTRETLPNGAVLVRYPGLPAIDSVGPVVSEVRVDLRFGSVEGDDPNLTFGDIRGVEAASDGTIYPATPFSGSTITPGG